MLEIRLLGEFDVRLEGQPIEIPSRPAQSLLAYLVLNAETRHRREKLAGLLWPESEESNARSNLRHALWRLRKAIGEKYFLADKVSIAFIPTEDCELDVSYFGDERTETESTMDLIREVSVYGGELLPGFYEGWVVLEREQLRAAFEHTIQRLLDLLIEKQSWLEVLEWGERWIATGYVPEPAYRALMIAYRGLGDSSGVAAVYQRCCEALHSELGVEPSEQTRSIYDRLSKGGEPSVIARVYPETGRVDTSVDAVRMLLKHWRQKGVEILDLASLAMVYAARPDNPFDPEDAALLLRSALHHEVDIEPWLERAGSPQVVVATLDEVLSTYPKPRVRMRIIQALKGLEYEEVDNVLLHVVESDDSAEIRTEAAVTLAQRGKQDVVVERLLEQMDLSDNAAAIAAFVAVADEAGLPDDVGPYPKLPVLAALAERRWKDGRRLLLRQVGRVSLGAVIISALHGSAAPFYIALSLPDSYHDTLQVLSLPTWILSGALGMMLIGGAQGLASSFAIGLADVFLRGRTRRFWRHILGSLAGFAHAGFLIVYTIMGNMEPTSESTVYISVCVFYSLLLGAALSIVFPQLGTSSSTRQQLKRAAWGAAAAALATTPYVIGYLFYFSEAPGTVPERLVFSILLTLGIALALRNPGVEIESASNPRI
ncbi:MAG: hypothetical protein E3J37_02060 [Anaerolineales bacterium]|nr:MAG: hypothetical protein E3J37_02060 [Anaerolineales bacterium]